MASCSPMCCTRRLREQSSWCRLRLKQDIILAMHNCPHRRHLGQIKTLARTRAQLFWPTLQKDCLEHVANCLKCAQRKSIPRQILLSGELKGLAPNDLVALDFMGPLEATPYRHNKTILVIVDHITRFTVAVPTKDQQAETVVQAILDHWVA
eukprot:m.54469 g.54469  ORF g.54469 m.54469 type:complete len:152 (+) comp48749_c0_seq1:796-1251(+)